MLLRPGHLTIVGPAVVSTGGAVSNTGLALHRLGIPVRLMGKIGHDLFGEAILSVFRSHSPALADGMLISPGEDSSYTLVINPPGVDRIFIHCPGANDTFGAADIPLDEVRGARIFHFGYPSLMRRMHVDDGVELAQLMANVKAAGVITSLDMSLPDPSSTAGRADWEAVLARTLPYVDIYAPNLEETLYMIDRPRYTAMAAGTLGCARRRASAHALRPAAGHGGRHRRPQAGRPRSLSAHDRQTGPPRRLGRPPARRPHRLGRARAVHALLPGKGGGHHGGRRLRLRRAAGRSALRPERRSRAAQLPPPPARAASSAPTPPAASRTGTRCRHGCAPAGRATQLALDLEGWQSNVDGTIWYGPADRRLTRGACL